MSKSKPYFSIVLPTFNRASFIEKAIESVMSQSFNNWELIIVDDGSTDNTKEIVASFIENDERIKYLYQENAERSAARNNGIKHAQGKFICFLDSDDIYHSSHLKLFADLIKEKNEEKALYFSGVSMNQYDCNDFTYNEEHTSPLEFVLLNTLATPRACVAKQLVISEQFNPNIRIGEDRELWCRIAQNNAVYHHKTNSIIQIGHNERSILGKSVYDSLETLKYILAKHQVNKKLAKRLCSNAYFNIAKYELDEKNRFCTFKYLAKSLLLDLGNKQSKLKLNALVKLLMGKNIELVKNMVS